MTEAHGAWDNPIEIEVSQPQAIQQTLNGRDMQHRKLAKKEAGPTNHRRDVQKGEPSTLKGMKTVKA